jgi:hypothetical protein
LHKRVSGTYFDKTKFALEVLARPEEQWVVPRYISEGLRWLEEVVTVSEAALEVNEKPAATGDFVIMDIDQAGAE